jgi:hypothetical protein
MPVMSKYIGDLLGNFRDCNGLGHWAGQTEQRIVAMTGDKFDRVNRQDLADLGSTGLDYFLKIPVVSHRNEKGPDNGVELREPFDIRAGMRHQVEAAVYGFEPGDDKGDELFRNNGTVLWSDKDQGIFFEFAQAVEKDIP